MRHVVAPLAALALILAALPATVSAAPGQQASWIVQSGTASIPLPSRRASPESTAHGSGTSTGMPSTRISSRHPGVAPVIGRRSLDEQFELALDVVVEGIAARLT